MDIVNLRWVLPALLLVPVVAQANKLSTEVSSGSTSYKVIKETVRAPTGSTVSGMRDITPTVTREPHGGLSQKAGGNLYIAKKGANVSFSGAFQFTKDNLKSGAKNVLKRNPLAFAGELGLMGLDKLLRDHGWEPYDETQDGEKNQGFKKPQSESSGPPLANEDTSIYRYGGNSGSYGWASNRGDGTESVGQIIDSQIVVIVHNSSYYGTCKRFYNDEPLVSYFHLGSIGDRPYCYFGYKDPADKPDKVMTEATASDIDNLVDDDYDPAPSDWDRIFPYIWPDSFTIDPIPSFSYPPVTSTTTNTTTGTTTTIESTTTVDFEIDNSVSTPGIVMTETQTDTKYENGEKVDETVITTPTAPSPNAPSTGTGGGGSDFELPSFCSWASVVCGWIDWTQQMPEGDEPDLKNLIQDYEFEQRNTITFGSKQCPEPITLNLVLINKPLNVSFDAFCSLAGYLYFLVMASSYIIAARITLGVARG